VRTEPMSGMSREESDSVLVTATKNGESGAFEFLVHRHETRLFATAFRITRNREDAQDVVQQTFQKAFINLKKFEGDSLFSTWLTRIAINEALMSLRRKRGSREVPIAESTTEEGAALPLDFPDSGPDPEDSCLQREQERILSAAVSELRPGLRKAIEPREFGELSTGETAQVLGLSVAAVKARLFHGRRALRQTLKRYVDSTRTHRTRASRPETRWLSTLIGQKQALREENYDAAIISGVISHSAGTPSADEVPSHSICPMAGALVGSSGVIEQ
jgi:RNA polymerase sigma-70 factor, ECF subfamily